MSDAVWIALLSAIPATVAALSSLKNGAEQKRVKRELAEVNGKITRHPLHKSPKKSAAAGGWERGLAGQSEDWYKPPDV